MPHDNYPGKETGEFHAYYADHTTTEDSYDILAHLSRHPRNCEKFNSCNGCIITTTFGIYFTKFVVIYKVLVYPLDFPI